MLFRSSIRKEGQGYSATSWLPPTRSGARRLPSTWKECLTGGADANRRAGGTAGDQHKDHPLLRGHRPPTPARPHGLRVPRLRRGRRRATHLHQDRATAWRSEEHTSELQSLMRISYAVFCLKKKNKPI